MLRFNQGEGLKRRRSEYKLKEKGMCVLDKETVVYKKEQDE